MHLRIIVKTQWENTGGYISILHGGVADFGSHLTVPAVMFSKEAEYIYIAVAYIRASYL